jgi:hypothetical protein
MERRRVLTVCGTVLTGALAGCGGGGGETTSTPTATATDAPAQTDTAAEQTATATPEPTETGTATSGVDGPTHELGESFTVGSGENAIGYRITDLYRADQLGSSANNATADGTFVIVILELSNPQSDATTFPRNEFLVTNEEQIRYIDENSTPLVDDDDRINVGPLANATVLAGSSKTGAVVFDLDPDRSYWIELRPIGSEGETHYVDIGVVSDLPALQSSVVG